MLTVFLKETTTTPLPQSSLELLLAILESPLPRVEDRWQNMKSCDESKDSIARRRFPYKWLVLLSIQIVAVF